MLDREIFRKISVEIPIRDLTLTGHEKREISGRNDERGPADAEPRWQPGRAVLEENGPEVWV